MSKSWEQNFLTNPRAAGVKATYIFSDKVSLTAGFYNTIDPKAPADNVSSTPSYGVSDFVTQLFVNPTKDLQLSAAYWREAQTVNGSHTNFQARYQLNKRLKLGLDFTRYKADTLAAVNSYTSAVLYAQEKLNNVFTIGGRYEYMDKTEAPNGINTFTYLPGYYSILTLTLNEKLGPIALKEEVKFDQTNKGNLNTVYLDKDAKPTDKATQLVIFFLAKKKRVSLKYKCSLFVVLTPNFVVSAPMFRVLAPCFVVLTPNFRVITPNFRVLTPNLMVLTPMFVVLTP